ncbi:MAG TPA: response regulator [Cytophagaceae bacterium]|jgi:CheY-like chemotaxis protein|nr:response regulator [Cytophagaceae bacterium]
MEKTLSIMLIDDNPTDLFVHERFLFHRKIAHEIIKFISAEDALYYLCEHPDLKEWPDLILLDIQMPVMNGFDFLDQCEKFSQLQKCKIIMLSSSLDFGDINRVKANPYVLALMEKPFDVDELMTLLEMNGVLN